MKFNKDEYKKIKEEIYFSRTPGVPSYVEIIRMRGYSSSMPTWKAQYEFRHRHIALCELRGTPFEKIESNHRTQIITDDDGNERVIVHNLPNRKYIDKIKDEYRQRLIPQEIEVPIDAETVRASS